MTLRLRHVAEINPPVPTFEGLADADEVTFHSLDTVWADGRADRTQRRCKADVANGFVRFAEDDILLPKTAPTFQHRRTMIASDLVNGSGVGSSELHVLRARPGNDPRFIAYTLRSEGFITAGVSAYQGVAGLQRVPADFVADWPMSTASFQEQQKIADFLDKQVALLDRAIELRHQQVALIRERAMAQTNEEVLVRLAQQQLVRVQHLVDEIDDRRGVLDLPLLSVSIHRGVVRRSELTSKEPRADDLSNYKVCQPGDICLNRMRAFQGAIGVAGEKGLVSPDYAVLRPRAGVEPDWLDLLFRSHWFIGQMTRMLRGLGSADLGNVRTPRVNVSDLRLIEVPDVERGDQIEILQTVRADAVWRNRVSELSQRQADLLVARKHSLITYAVNGDLDVAAMRKVST